MNEISHPIPSKMALAKASLIAAIIAAITLVFVILPAEYNIDPTGVGNAIGLTQLANPGAVSAINSHATGEQSDSVTLVIPPGKGMEYKFYLNQYANMQYQWMSTSGDRVYFDFHGEPEGDTTGYFESYTESISSEVKGSMTAPFAGSHGWYWRNDSLTPVQIILTTSGNYTLIGNPAK